MRKNNRIRISPTVMAGLDPATHRARVGGRKRHCVGAQTRAGWVTGSGASHDEKGLANRDHTGGIAQ